MSLHRLPFLLLAISAASGCSEDRRQSKPPPIGVAACSPNRGAILLGRDSLAGISMRAHLGELLSKCSGATIDTVSPGGYQVLSVRIPLGGATVWAVSDSEPYTSHMDLAQRPS